MLQYYPGNIVSQEETKVCKISLLIIGNSFKRNKDIIKRVKDESDSLTVDKVQVFVKTIDPLSSGDINPHDYDLAVVDEHVMDKGCSKELLVSGLPILSWDIKPLSKYSEKTISSVVRSVVEKSLLCEHIVKITKEIEETHQIISSSFGCSNVSGNSGVSTLS
jgi:hypothetical protein